MISNFVLGIAVMLATGLLFGKIAKAFKLPNVTGYLLGGFIIGPTFLKIFFPSFDGLLGADFINVLRLVVDIELGFIAFTIGTEFKVSYFKKVGAKPVIIAFVESIGAVIFIFAGVMLVGLAFGVPVYFALCLAGVGAATAPAATIMVIRQYKAKGPFTQTIFSVVAIDDASALIYFGVVMAIVQALISPGGNIALTILMPFVEIIGSVVLGAVTGILLTLLVKPFSSKGNRLILVIIMLFVNIGISIVLGQNTVVNLSPLLASMLTGAIFTNTSKSVDQVMPEVEAITPPFVVLFFIMAGADLQIKAMSLVSGVLIATYLVFRVAGKIFGAWASCKMCKMPDTVTKNLGFGLLPQGGIAIGLSATVAATLNNAGVAAPFNSEMLILIVLCAVFVSEVFGPLLCKFALIKSGEGVFEPKRSKKNKQALSAQAPSSNDDNLNS